MVTVRVKMADSESFMVRQSLVWDYQRDRCSYNKILRVVMETIHSRRARRPFIEEQKILRYVWVHVCVPTTTLTLCEDIMNLKYVKMEFIKGLCLCLRL